MFSQATLVKVINSIERTFIARCDIVEFTQIINQDGSTLHDEITTNTNVPCKVSYASTSFSKDTRHASGISQNVKLFIGLDVKIKPGSKLIITQNNVTTIFENSSPPLIYLTHQEYQLMLFKEWT